jgi:hypothetical protein
VSEGAGEVYSNIDHRFYYYPTGSPGDIVYSSWQLNSPLFADIDWDITGLTESTGYTYGVEWRYSAYSGTTFEILGYFTTHAFPGIIFPSDPMTRITGLVHRYDRRKGIYQLEIYQGDVTTVASLAYSKKPVTVIPPLPVFAGIPPKVGPGIIDAITNPPTFTFGGGTSGGSGASGTWNSLPPLGYIAPPIIPTPSLPNPYGIFWSPDTPQQTITKITDQYNKTRSSGFLYE